MTDKAPLALLGRNPDVLTCIANLSNDEVFTPPEFANRMIDNMATIWAAGHEGEDLWANPDATFLDPFTKSGVFLREITARLIDGLKEVIPDLQQRVHHILTKQVYGIGITGLTAMLSRRSLYCSKWANGPHSIAKNSFDTAQGHIWFERLEHTWVGGTEWVYTPDESGKQVKRYTNGRCKYCPATQNTLDRGADRESHAYAFTHTDDIEIHIAQLFGEKMQFDVVIGNPPYQLQADGGTRDVPIYQHFVEQAKKLEPRLLAMVIPSRWMAGGLGLAEFRKSMLSDSRIRELVDYPNAAEVFPTVGINGGVCHFLWESSYNGDCNITMIRGTDVVGPVARSLNEFDVLVRDARALGILRKVLSPEVGSVNSILARDKEFGWTSNFDGFHEQPKHGDIPLYYIRSMKRGHGYINRKSIAKSEHLVDTWKLLVPKVGSGREREKTGVDLVLGPPLIAPSPSVCTQSFLFFYVQSEDEAKSIRSYYATKFFRFLVSLRKITQDATHSTYSWVPLQSWDREWTDGELYEKYGLTEEEASLIERLIRPMGLPND